MVKCDIIIPIYNAFDCLKPCFDSIENNTDLNNHHVILINDKSTDERVDSFLKKYVKKHKGFTLLENSENLGFVGTVNKGMKYSSNNDVLLLNSDTEVTPNWLDNIIKCAYSMPNVATVTPLSNNATLVSVPNMFEVNDVPDGMSIDDMAKEIEEASFKDYPEVPTGHGFCLYIRREILNKVGYFDEKTYGKGYGEENDFCFRCLDAGFRNLVCDNAYIFHKESQSFSSQKEKLIAEGLEALTKKYPNYKSKLDSWCSNKKLTYIGQNISFSIGSKNNNPNILIIIHDWNDIKNNAGGTSLHVWDIIRYSRNKFNFHVLSSKDGIYRLNSYWSNHNMESELVFNRIQSFSEYPFYNDEYRKMVAEIIDMFNISLIHIHHLINHYFDIINIAKLKKIPTIMTLHDYYCVCPTINKLFCNITYCNKGDILQCKECLSKKFSSVQQSLIFIESWRNEWKKNMSNVDLLLTPSEAAKDEILLTYPKLKIDVIEHGVDYKKTIAKQKINKDEIMDIAFIGAIGVHKGSKILLDFVKTRKLKNVKVHLFGFVDAIHSVSNNKHFINHGRYKRDELPNLLKENNIKVICLFSTWPETFSYTLTESVACGIPVLAFDFGAIAERIKKYNLGWVIPPNSTMDDIYLKISEIHNNVNEYNQTIQSINDYKFKKTVDMSIEYQNIYQKRLIKMGNNVVKKDVISNLIYNQKKDYINVTYSNYAWVFDTFKWKLISKFKIPHQIKKVIRKVKKND